MRRINWLLLAGIWTASLLAYPRLPSRIPRHFDAAGEVTRWGETSLLSWLALPLIALVTLAGAEWVTRMMRTRPHWVNLPDRDKLLALPRERQAPVLARMGDLLHGTMFVTMVILALVQYAVWQRAHGAGTTTMMAIILVLALMTTPLVLGIWLPRVSEEVERQTNEHRARGGVP